MESALNGLSQMAILIIVAAVGFLAAKLDYLDEYTNQKLTKLLLNITLPCMVVASVHGLSAADAGETVGITFAMAIAQGILLLLVGWLLVVVLRRLPSSPPWGRSCSSRCWSRSWGWWVSGRHNRT